MSILNACILVLLPRKNADQILNLALNESQQICLATDVLKCLNGLSPEQFKQYFKHHQHEKRTRGSNLALILPLNRTESSKQAFVFRGAKLFNKLPKDVRGDEGSFVLFKHNPKLVVKTLSTLV